MRKILAQNEATNVSGEANGDFKCINEKSLKWQIYLRNKQSEMFIQIEISYSFDNESDMIRDDGTSFMAKGNQRPSQRVAFEDFIYAYQFLNRLCSLSITDFSVSLFFVLFGNCLNWLPALHRNWNTVGPGWARYLSLIILSLWVLKMIIIKY